MESNYDKVVQQPPASAQQVRDWRHHQDSGVSTGGERVRILGNEKEVMTYDKEAGIIKDSGNEKVSRVINLKRDKQRYINAERFQLLHHRKSSRQLQTPQQLAPQKTTTTATLPLSNCHAVLWTGTISVGTPAQNFTVDIDTGSSDLCIPSSRCDATCRADGRRYDESLSRTAEGVADDAALVEFLYGDGERADGYMTKDVVSLSSGVTVLSQAFAQITHVDSFLTCGDEEGVMGFGRGMYGADGVSPSVLNNLFSLDILKNPVFSVYLDSSIEEQQHSSSQLILGGVKRSLYNGCLSWQNPHNDNDNDGNDGRRYWGMALSNIEINGAKMYESAAPPAVIDTGSTFVVGPRDAVQWVATMNDGVRCFVLDDSGAFDRELPCDGSDLAGETAFDVLVVPCQRDFFDLEFVMEDGSVFLLGKKDLLKPLADSAITSANAEGHVTDDLCLVRISPNDNIQGWILGDPFLTKHYVAFNFETKAVGLAERVLMGGVNDKLCDTDLALDIDINDINAIARDTTANYVTNSTSEDNMDNPEKQPNVVTPITTDTAFSTSVQPSPTPQTTISYSNTIDSTTESPYIPTTSTTLTEHPTSSPQSSSSSDTDKKIRQSKNLAMVTVTFCFFIFFFIMYIKLKRHATIQRLKRRAREAASQRRRRFRKNKDTNEVTSSVDNNHDHVNGVELSTINEKPQAPDKKARKTRYGQLSSFDDYEEDNCSEDEEDFAEIIFV